MVKMVNSNELLVAGKVSNMFLYVFLITLVVYVLFIDGIVQIII